jgi:hypothetical protein
MIEMVKSPSMRVLSKGCLALWLVVSIVFALLFLAAGAQARGTNASDGATATPIGEAATAGGAPAEQAPTEAEAPPAAEEAPATAQAPPAAGEAPTTAQAPPAAEEAPTGAEASPPADEASTTAEAPPATGEASTTAEASPTTEETSTAAEAPPAAERGAIEALLEQAASEVAAEAGAAGPATEETARDSQASVVASSLSHEEAAGGSIAVTSAIVTGASPEISTSPVQTQLPPTLRPRKISARRAGQVGCELAPIGAPITAGCAGGWLGISAAPSVSTTPFTTAGKPPASTADAPAGNEDGGGAVENHPAPPTPGPGPGGAGGGSAAGAGSGSASSAAFTLVGVLLQAGPRALRRLRLAQPSWRTSFFVLIPERPD